MTDDQRLRELEEKYEDYKVYDNAGEKIGKVDDLFVDEADREEYIGVKMGLFGLSGTTLIPMEIARVNERDKTIEVSESKDRVKDSPKFSDDDEITPEYEDRIRRHFRLESHEPSTERGFYGRYAGSGAGRATEGATLAEGGRPRDERDAEDRNPASTMSGDEVASATRLVSGWIASRTRIGTARRMKVIVAKATLASLASAGISVLPARSPASRPARG